MPAMTSNFWCTPQKEIKEISSFYSVFMLVSEVKLSQIPTLKTHISYDQFLISMFSLGVNIGRKRHALMKAWAGVFNENYLNNKITVHVTMW